MEFYDFINDWWLKIKCLVLLGHCLLRLHRLSLLMCLNNSSGYQNALHTIATNHFINKVSDVWWTPFPVPEEVQKPYHLGQGILALWTEFWSCLMIFKETFSFGCYNVTCIPAFLDSKLSKNVKCDELNIARDSNTEILWGVTRTK